MAELNLLDKTTKRRIAKDIQSISLVNNMILLTIVLLVISGVLFGTEKYLDYETVRIEEIGAQNVEESQIGQINNKMGQVSLIQADYVKWSKVLIDFSALVPGGNRLQTISLDKENQTLSMHGTSDQRDDFLKFKENLENSSLVSELESPISNLLHQADISFSLKAKLNL